MIWEEAPLVARLACNRELIDHPAAYAEILGNNTNVHRVATNMLAASHHIGCLSRAEFLDDDLVR